MTAIIRPEAEGSLKIVPLPEDPVKEFRGLLKGFPLLTELFDSRREDCLREEFRVGQAGDAGIPAK